MFLPVNSVIFWISVGNFIVCALQWNGNIWATLPSSLRCTCTTYISSSLSVVVDVVARFEFLTCPSSVTSGCESGAYGVTSQTIIASCSFSKLKDSHSVPAPIFVLKTLCSVSTIALRLLLLTFVVLVSMSTVLWTVWVDERRTTYGRVSAWGWRERSHA